MREKIELFSIMYSSSHGDRKFFLSKTLKDEYTLFFNDSKVINAQKISNRVAQKLDKKFSEEFINIKYMEVSKYIEKCEKKPWLVVLRGESFSVCEEDEKRYKVLKELVALLESNKGKIL